MPAPQLMSLLFSIEQAVVAIGRKRPRLVDKEVEAIFVLYRKFFQEMRQGKDVDDPYTTLMRKQEVIDEIWAVLVYREQQQADAEHLNGSFRVADRQVSSPEELYILAFNELRKSVRFWRKRGGPKGYLKHIEEHLLETLGSDHQFFHGKVSEDTDQEQGQLQLRFDWLMEEHGIQLTIDPNRELPEDVTEEQAIYHKSFSRNPAAHVERLREVCEDYPEHPQLTNDLIGALFAAGHAEEAQAMADKMVQDHPDYLFGISQYLTNTNDGQRLKAMAHLLGPDRQITHFTPGKGGAYHLQEFLKYEEAVTNVLCAEMGYDTAISRLERVLGLNLPPMALANSANKIALLHFAKLAQADENDASGTVPALPPDVEGCEQAVTLVREVFAGLVRGLRG